MGARRDGGAEAAPQHGSLRERCRRGGDGRRPDLRPGEVRAPGGAEAKVRPGQLLPAQPERQAVVASLIVNVCPVATSSAPPERIWSVVTMPERFEEWVDARFVSAEPPGPAQPGQVIRMSAPELGRQWPVRIEVGDMDPGHRWIDL